MEQILINLVAGALGGVGVGKSSPTFDLGIIGNIISGLIGGGVLGQIVTLLLPAITDEQVHGGDVSSVVTQEGAPALGRRSTSLDHVLRDARLSDLKAELEQLAMNARRTPQRIFGAHPPDQRA